MRSYEVEIAYVDSDQHAYFIVKGESPEVAAMLARLDAETIDEVDRVVAVVTL